MRHQHASAMKFRKRLTIIIVILLAISTVLGGILIFVGSDISKRTEQIIQAKRDLLFRLQSTETLALLRRDSQGAKNYTYELNNILPSRDQLINFPRDLAIIARQNKIELNAGLGKESVSDGNLAQTNFNMTGQGSSDNFIAFLKSVETAKYFINLDSIDFIQQGNTFRALINGRVFSF